MFLSISQQNIRFVDRDMFMRHLGGGIGHSTEIQLAVDSDCEEDKEINTDEDGNVDLNVDESDSQESDTDHASTDSESTDDEDDEDMSF